MPKDEDLASVTAMADRMGLEGDARDRYIHKHMQMFGYKPRMDWDEPDGNEEQEDDNDFFAAKKKREQRPVGGGASGGGAAASGGGKQNWQYGE
jgi:hypothetical protein